VAAYRLVEQWQFTERVEGAAMTERLNLTGVLDHMDDQADGRKVTLGSIMDSLGGRGYGPLLLALALIEILPTGAIPGVPSLVALMVVLVAGQLVLGRRTPWVPEKLRKRGFEKKKLERAKPKVRRVTRKIDKILKPRLEQLANPLAVRLVAAVCVLLAITMPPLELLPFASSGPALAIAIFGVGLSVHDGLVILVGLVIALAAIGGTIYWLAF
jgi:hypothetical protein